MASNTTRIFLLFVSDVMVIHHAALSILSQLGKYFKMKPGSIGDPAMYLRATLKKMRLAKGKYERANSPAKYVWALCKNVKSYLTDLGDKKWKVPSHCAIPFATDYEPELDENELLDPELASWYTSLIDMLRWMVNIGRVDIH